MLISALTVPKSMNPLWGLKRTDHGIWRRIKVPKSMNPLWGLKHDREDHCEATPLSSQKHESSLGIETKAHGMMCRASRLFPKA